MPGRFPSYLVEHMTGVEEKVREDPRWQEAMRKRGVTDFEPGDDRPVARRLLRATGSLRQLAADLPAADVHAGGAVRARLCAAGRGPDRHVRPRRDGGHRHRGSRCGAAAADRGQLRPRSSCSTRTTGPRSPSSAPTSSRSRSPSPTARASPSTAGRCSGRSGRCGLGFNPREGITLHEVTYTDRGETRPDHVPGVAVGDGGALRRHRADPLEQERLRHG